MFSGDMVNSLRLITDLHKMIQLIKKLLTGTMHLNKNFIQSRLRNNHIQHLFFEYMDLNYIMTEYDTWYSKFNFRLKLEFKIRATWETKIKKKISIMRTDVRHYVKKFLENIDKERVELSLTDFYGFWICSKMTREKY